MSEQDKRVYQTDMMFGALNIIDTRSKTLVGRVKLGYQPRPIAVDTERDLLFVELVHGVCAPLPPLHLRALGPRSLSVRTSGSSLTTNNGRSFTLGHDVEVSAQHQDLMANLELGMKAMPGWLRRALGLSVALLCAKIWCTAALVNPSAFDPLWSPVALIYRGTLTVMLIGGIDLFLTLRARRSADMEVQGGGARRCIAHRFDGPLGWGERPYHPRDRHGPRLG